MPCGTKQGESGAVHSSKSEYNMQTHPNQRNVVPRIKRGIFAHITATKKFFTVVLLSTNLQFAPPRQKMSA